MRNMPLTINQYFEYPLYPSSEQFYNQSQKALSPIEELDDEDRADMDMDLDVPGADLDDEQEAVGNEDEENNYYSIGGDDHNDLEEAQN